MIRIGALVITIVFFMSNLGIECSNASESNSVESVVYNAPAVTAEEIEAGNIQNEDHIGLLEDINEYSACEYSGDMDEAGYEGDNHDEYIEEPGYEPSDSEDGDDEYAYYDESSDTYENNPEYYGQSDNYQGYGPVSNNNMDTTTTGTVMAGNDDVDDGYVPPGPPTPTDAGSHNGVTIKYSDDFYVKTVSILRKDAQGRITYQEEQRHEYDDSTEAYMQKDGTIFEVNYNAQSPLTGNWQSPSQYYKQECVSNISKLWDTTKNDYVLYEEYVYLSEIDYVFIGNGNSRTKRQTIDVDLTFKRNDEDCPLEIVSGHDFMFSFDNISGKENWHLKTTYKDHDTLGLIRIRDNSNITYNNSGTQGTNTPSAYAETSFSRTVVSWPDSQPISHYSESSIVSNAVKNGKPIFTIQTVSGNHSNGYSYTDTFSIVHVGNNKWTHTRNYSVSGPNFNTNKTATITCLGPMITGTSIMSMKLENETWDHQVNSRGTKEFVDLMNNILDAFQEVRTYREEF